MALDAKTGAYRWHYQQIHHDLWDYDSGNPVVLFDLPIDGKLRRGIAEANKSGWVYILDRTNGKPLLGIDEKPVAQEPRQLTSPTQPIPRGDAFVPQAIDIAPEGFALVNGGRVFTPYWTDYVLAKPGITGGANWPPSSYDAASGYFYVCASDRASVFRAWEITADRPAEGAEYIGGNFGAHTIPGLGTFTALDLHTNKIAWQQQWSDPCYSGSVVTAGGLVFVGRSDGRLTALNSSTGAKLWEFQTGAGMNSTPSVFERKGKQYVVAYSGGSVFAHSAKGDSVWLFALDGTLDPVPPGQ
jgi:alcohol dehydrogenase (cytochrome c)